MSAIVLSGGLHHHQAYATMAVKPTAMYQQQHPLAPSQSHAAYPYGQQQQLHQQQQHQRSLAAHAPGATALRAIDTNQMRPKPTKPQPHPYAATAAANAAVGLHQPAAVLRRNARERNRVKQVNNGFTNLRQHIPGDIVQALTNGGRGASKKLSKVDTLKVAVEYIRRLQELLVYDDEVHGGRAAATTTTTTTVTAASQASPDGKSYRSGLSAPSPTPSYASELSVDSSIEGGAAATHSTVSTTAMPMGGGVGGGYKYEPYDAPYNAEDEELLDCISWWQQQ